MTLYLIQIDIGIKNVDEFARNLRTLWFEFLREKGCKGYRVYQELGKETSFCIIGEFEDLEQMEKHFRTRNFQVLMGAAGVLGESFKISTCEVHGTGDLESFRAGLTE